jgi:nucleolar complex protein 3
LDNFEEISDNEEMALLEEANESEDDLDLDNDEQMEQLLAQQQQQQQQNNKKKVAKVDNESDEEMDYEMKPRKVASEWTRKDYHTKLPIKLASGKIHQLDENQESEEEEDEEKVPTFTAPPIEQPEEDEEEEEIQPKLSKKEYLLKKKEELALIASNLQGDPEEYVSQLKTLRSIYRDDNITVKKLALLTQLAVYKDIIPGYRIRPLTALEEETQVSRDVKKMREYEKALLSNYELYLKDLNVLLSSKFLLLLLLLFCNYRYKRSLI